GSASSGHAASTLRSSTWPTPRSSAERSWLGCSAFVASSSTGRPTTESAMADSRLLPVPDGLDGLRPDVAISRLMGFSRTAAADLIDAGHVTVDGAAPARSAKVRGGSLLEVTVPEPATLSVQAEPVDGLVVLYDDQDVV